MKDNLYKQSYFLALAGLTGRSEFVKRAGETADFFNHVLNGGKLYLAWKFLPALLAATAIGAGGGYVMNRLSRHSDPSVADSGTKGDIDRVERLKRIQYYDALVRQLDTNKSRSGKD